MECITATAAALPEETPLLDTETLCQEDQEKEDAETLTQMEELLAIQRTHLKVRENHMNLMREALADLGHKRQELVTLKTQVADAVKKNDADAVNSLHIRVTELQESQSKYADLLHVSTSAAAEAYSASEHANPATSIEVPEQSNPETETLLNQEVDGDTLHAAYDDVEVDEDDEDAEAEDINSFIAMNLTALLEEINSIDPTTEESSEASEWVSQQRDALIAQLEELQIMSRLEEEKRREQIQVLQEKQDELEGFKAQIEALSTQIEEQNTVEVQAHGRQTSEDGTLHQDL
ncbi:hypothetical protein BJ741DRAFT_634412 [Chytriomyces cf. hyalinus JEL632]|nr:hypothetical protein BJ741DRAFT_634412 [Chytriomyces cf. hyalinus JEL632]